MAGFSSICSESFGRANAEIYHKAVCSDLVAGAFI